MVSSVVEFVAAMCLRSAITALANSISARSNVCSMVHCRTGYSAHLYELERSRRELVFNYAVHARGSAWAHWIQNFSPSFVTESE